jgi:hypothetical protein
MIKPAVCRREIHHIQWLIFLPRLISASAVEKECLCASVNLDISYITVRLR